MLVAVETRHTSGPSTAGKVKEFSAMAGRWHVGSMRRYAVDLGFSAPRHIDQDKTSAIRQNAVYIQVSYAVKHSM